MANDAAATCSSCAACCQYVRLQVSPQYLAAKRWLELHGIKLVRRGQRVFVYIPTPCSALQDGRCSIYEERPEACRTWPNSQADIDEVNTHMGREVCRFSQEE
ncbi:hypothetical protein LCGC14_2321650 [marine sediment metagenome]|uniref:Zinc/iron-chelating domain-containing protein n=1 Tax=marine sediment metagenome TaxID=412755 RepID=A0A0F9D572_9ZZZZ